MVVNGAGAMKRMVKRRVTADLADFLTFGCGDDAYAPPSPFRTAVRIFLSNNALLPPPSSLFPHLLTWQILFRVGDVLADDGGPAVVCVDVVEEDVARSRSVYCDQCRVVGWSNNPVSAKRYHFIIKADGNSIAGYSKSCGGCGAPLHMADSRCKSCGHIMTTEDVEDWIHQQLENTTHLLHGVVHANGYGHLLRLNGREGGSKRLSGSSILSFWDRLCQVLGVRKISVMDVSKKLGMNLRLLHAVAKGHSWYGDWGYRFATGSFCLTFDDYKLALQNISTLPLSLFLQSQARKPRTRLEELVLFYQSLSERELVHIRDLFSFLMSLIQDSYHPCHSMDGSPRKKLKMSEPEPLSLWTADDIGRVESAMFKVLRAVRASTWVSWRALRGAVFRAGSPDLLDYCLKELKGKEAAPGMVVCTRCTSDSSAMEYRLEPGSPSTNAVATPRTPSCPSKERLWQDMKYFYDCMLNPDSSVNHLPMTSRYQAIGSAITVLDCKQFMKDYHPESSLTLSKAKAVHLLCEINLTEPVEEHDLPKPPPELIVLPHDATIADLKIETTKAFQSTYLTFRRFHADELVGYSGVEESTQLKLLLGSTEFVQIKGRVLGKKSGSGRFRMERGIERWVLDCLCGARDDDGERMLACDVCGTWQHTRCSGIPDTSAVPSVFYCRRCVVGLQRCEVEVRRDSDLAPPL